MRSRPLWDRAARRRKRWRNSCRAGLVWERMRPEPGGSGLIALSCWTSGAIHLFHLLSKIKRSRLPNYISNFKDSCQRNGCILRIKDFIHKRSACSHPFCYFNFRYLFFIHEMLKLPSYNTFYSRSFAFFIKPFLFEEVIKRRSNAIIRSCIHISLQITIPFHIDKYAYINLKYAIFFSRSYWILFISLFH